MLEINEMTDDELRKLSLEKIRDGKMKGCATYSALVAQKILHERAGCPFQSSYKWKRDHSVAIKF